MSVSTFLGTMGWLAAVCPVRPPHVLQAQAQALRLTLPCASVPRAQRSARLWGRWWLYLPRERILGEK